MAQVQPSNDIEAGIKGTKPVESSRPAAIGWWKKRYDEYLKEEDGPAKTKEAILNDYTAWVVFVALLMTVDFAALFVLPEGSRAGHEWLLLVYVGLFAMGAVASVSAAFSGIHGYNYYNGIPVHMLERAIQAAVDLPQPVQYAPFAVIPTFLGAIVGIYLIFGAKSLIVAAILFGIGVFEYIRITLCVQRSFGRLPEIFIAVKDMH